jgi:ankyrin repeat protein
MAAPFGPPELIGDLLDAGSDVNAKDVRGMTPLMLAVAADHQDAAVIQVLLAHGANPSIRSGIGTRPWTGPAGPRCPPGHDLLKAGPSARTDHPAPASVARKLDPKSAVEKTLPLIEKSSWDFFNASGCVSCHAQSMTDLAVVLLAQRAFRSTKERRQSA